jgi:hypothetical protein
MPEPIRTNIIFADIGGRFQSTQTVQGSPIAAAAETIIGTVNIAGFGDTTLTSGIQFDAWAAFTVGTSGTAATLRIRQTNVAGTVVATSGALTVVAANLVQESVMGFDATPGVATYVLTLQITAGAANTTISAMTLQAILV